MGLNRSLTRQPRLLLVSLMMVAGFGAFADSAAAQEETTPVTTFVRLCLEPGCTEDLTLTETIDGVPVTVTDETGADIGTCTTGDSEPGACVVDVPNTVTSVTISLDEAAFPEGYSADDNPATFSLADTTEYPFLLMPAEGFPEEDPQATASVAEEAEAPPADDATVSQLPETGSGQESGTTTVLVTGLVALTSVSGLLAVVARRAVGRR